MKCAIIDQFVSILLSIGILSTIVHVCHGLAIEVDEERPMSLVSGRLASAGDCKYLVALMVGGSSNEERGSLLCGGAIISERHILTAAHCVENDTNLTVLSGIVNLDDRNGKIHRVSKIIRHPDFVHNYTINYLKHDVAILTLVEPLTLGNGIRKVEIPKIQPRPGSIATVAGWGYTSKKADRTSTRLYKADIELIDKIDCQKKMGYLTEDLLCGYDFMTTTCGGDSGSPLVRGKLVVGVVSMSSCTSGYAHIYENVFWYRDWILKTMTTT